MKAFTAGLFAVVILYAVDSQYNDGRYAHVIEHAVTSLVR